MTFFYDLNKKLVALEAKHKDEQLAESAPATESKFSKLAKEIGKNPKVKNPAAVAATIGREKYGQKAMTAKSVAGKKKAHEELDEKFEQPVKINPEKKGMFKGKTNAELMKQLSHLKATGPHEKGSEAYTKMKELQFAIRAKSGWGKVSEGTCPSCHCNPCECVEEGNAFTGKLAHTPKGGKFKLGNKEFTDTSSLEEADVVSLEDKKAKPDYIDLDGDGDRKESMKKAAADKKKSRSAGTAFDPEVAKSMFAHKDEHPRHDVKDTGYSKRYTRKHDQDMDKDDEVKSNEPKKKGRPNGPAKGPERTTKHAYKHKGERKVKEDEEYDAEGDMAKGDMHTVIRHARELEKHLRDNDNLPTWVIEKLGQIKGMMTSVSDYIMSEKERGIEKATGEEGIAIGEKITKKTPAGEIISDFEKSKNKKFAGKSKEERKNQALGAYYGMHPEKSKKKKEVEETTTAGSVATAPAAPAKSGGMQFGKGVYESLDRQFKQALTESIQVQENVEECGMEMSAPSAPSVTVTADGEEAIKLMALLKLAGLTGEQAVEEAYGDTDETKNEPDWPTDKETTGNNDEHLRRWSAGLNGPKSTGQTTIPVVASQLRRQTSMEENVELERSLFKTWKNYKG